jgi:hypothetical protein
MNLFNGVNTTAGLILQVAVAMKIKEKLKRLNLS